jgi:hypothetical protein
MRTIMLLVALSLTACGKSDDNDAPAKTPEVGADETEDKAAAAKTGTATATSLAIASAADLPPCDEAHNLQLVYLLAEKQFKTCQAGEWVDITIEAAAPEVDVNRLRNAIMAIEIGDTFDTMLPEAKEYILSLGEREEINATTVDYTIKAELDDSLPGCNRAYYFQVSFQNDAVASAPYDGCAE